MRHSANYIDWKYINDSDSGMSLILDIMELVSGKPLIS